jgi:serine-type D-Ala-D-Ala carboxypeptidase (penicillin-binding protein 5/6)
MRAYEPGLTPMRLILLFWAVITQLQLVAAQPSATFQTSAAEAILIDADSGSVLFEKNADKLFAPASMSKIMTLEILFKKLKAGEISPETEFPVSLYAWRTGGAPSRTTSMFVPLNQTAGFRPHSGHRRSKCKRWLHRCSGGACWN